MRVFAISDIHIDFAENKNWLFSLSESDYTEDILILGGDVTDIVDLQIESFKFLRKRFREVIFVAGNHDLWVMRNGVGNSLARFEQLIDITADLGVSMKPLHISSLSIIPLNAWYDYSFGSPSKSLLNKWTDFGACKWPNGYDALDITRYFLSLNELIPDYRNQHVITVSHFLPRIDLMPSYIPYKKRFIYPVLGTSRLDQQIQKLQPDIHVYGHSHVNNFTEKDGVTYINNAYGYPSETRITRKRLLCVFEND